MTDKKYYLWLIPGVLLVGLALTLVLTFQPAMAEVAVTQAVVDPTCTLDTTDAISYWPLDETSGTTFADSMTGSHDGTCSGDSCPSPISGTNAGGQFFVNTDSDVINVASHTDFDFATTDKFSVGIWVKTTQNCTGNKVYIGRYRNLVSEGRWWLGCQQSGSDGVARFHMRDSNGLVFHSAVGSTRINDGKWHYLTGVWDSTNTELYVDGVLEASVSSPAFTGNFASTEPLTIGAYDEDTEGYYVNGALDEAAIFDVALDGTFINNYRSTCSWQNLDVRDVTFDNTPNAELIITAGELKDGSTGTGPLTITAIDGTSNKGGSITGTLPDGPFTYDPPGSEGDIIGTDFFTFELDDGTNSARATAIITQEAPVVTNPGAQTDYEGAAVSLQIQATDPNGDTLTYEAAGLPSGLTIDASTGLISGNVGAGASSGSPYDPVTVTVTDVKDFSTQIDFVWTVNPNEIPEVNPIADQADNEGETITPLQVVASDGDSDSLTYSAVVLPPGLSINPTTGLISGTVSVGASTLSPYSVTVSVSDGKAAPVETSFDWYINGPPDVIKPYDQFDMEGDAVSLQVAATDPDGDDLVYSATDLPPGLSINPATGLISGTISAGASTFSPYTVKVKATDPGGLYDEETFFWTVSLDLPKLYLPLVIKTFP